MSIHVYRSHPIVTISQGYGAALSAGSTEYLRKINLLKLGVTDVARKAQLEARVRELAEFLDSSPNEELSEELPAWRG